MSGKLYFYVCEKEYSSGKYNGFATNAIKQDSREGVSFKFCEDDFRNDKNMVRIIVVNGEQLNAKKKVNVNYSSSPRSLSELLVKYFMELEIIANKLLIDYNLENWKPDQVCVITHWGGSPVERREMNVARAVDEIPDAQQSLITHRSYKFWKTVSSSSIRKSAFEARSGDVFFSGYNPFLSNTDAPANLPSARICELLEKRLPIASKIKWEDIISTTSEMELKESYDRLMVKLNH